MCIRDSFNGADPIGRDVIIGTMSRRVVGVVADLKDGPPDSPAKPAMYVPFGQPSFSLVVRTTQPTDAIASTLAATIRAIRPDLVVSRVTSMTDKINSLPSAYLRRSSTWLVSGFATMAFVLGIVGLYGVIAYSVSQRHREIGVRIALGAERGRVYRLVLGEAGWLTLVGLSLIHI